MKTQLYILVLILIVSSTFTAKSSAQSYPFPNRQLVQTLLDELADCKKTKTETETRIAFMESNPGNYTLAQYLSAKEFLKDLKNCIKSNRAQLERLRKDYPEWFNSPSAFTDLRLSPPRLRNPPEMEDAIRELQEALDDMTNRFADLVQPEH